MRILLTNNTLGSLQGTELYIYDVAVELLRRGHTPIAFSTSLGEVARKLRAATVPVIDNLADCGETPDIIHGQHHYETLTASLYFAETPVINFCHGWSHVEEEPLISPRVLRYVAVDETCRDRLIFNFGIDPARVTVLLNFVDLQRFKPRVPLPERPRFALAFGNYFTKGKSLAAIEEACREADIQLDVAGWGSNHAIADPQSVLPRYDIVFAKGRAALEAMAVGTAVVLAGIWRSGPMVTTQNWARLRRMNFGVRAHDFTYSKEGIAEQISHFNPQNAAVVNQLVRETADLRATVDCLIDLYGEAIEENRGVRIDGHAVERAAARHLNRYALAFKPLPLQSRDMGEASRHAYNVFLKAADVKNATLELDIAGCLDSVDRRYGIVRVTGWAADVRSKQPVAAIIFLESNQCVGFGFPSFSRPDAAAWMGVREDLFGFEIQFQAGEGSLRVLVLAPSGEVFDISGFANAEVTRVLKGFPSAE